MSAWVFVLVLTLFPSPSRDVIRVPIDYPTIQEAIDNSSHGDLILVAVGTYVENINFLGKEITVRSDIDLDENTYDISPANTIIDGSSPGDPNKASVVTFENFETEDSVLDGFTLTGGLGTYDPQPLYDRCGGGIYCLIAGPTIMNNIIFDNMLAAPSAGGGMYMRTSFPSLSGNRFEGNSIEGIMSTHIGYGGGVCCVNSSPKIVDNIFKANTTYDYANGAAIACLNSSPLISMNEFTSNEMFPASYGGYWGGDGAGVYCFESNPSINQNIFKYNKAASGCGVACCENSNPVITKNLFEKNETLSPGSGGGVYCLHSFPVIDDNHFINNTADAGGGIQGNCQVLNNTFDGNVADGSGTHAGGGAVHKATVIINNVMENNEASHMGGAIVTSIQGTIEGNTIHNNIANYGGAICCPDNAYKTLYIRHNDIQDNIASDNGGAIWTSWSATTIEANLILDNRATNDGGGLYLSQVNGAAPLIRNNVIAQNLAGHAGGGICANIMHAKFYLINNTIADNESMSLGGGGLYTNDCTDVISENNIFWNNGGTVKFEIYLDTDYYGSNLTIDYCCLMGGKNSIYVAPGSSLVYGAHMIELDPEFVDPENGDYHIKKISPCIDVGNNSAPKLPDTDFDGDPRIVCGLEPGFGKMQCPLKSPPPAAIVDMGMDEYCIFKKKKYVLK